jgi:DNA-binding response OmpR family regulator
MTPPEEAPRINVLVVDDDEDTSVLLGLLLGRQGWGTMFASDLEQARSALERADVSALVTDVSLPDGSGLSLLANRRPSLRAAVVITGRAGEEERRESTRVGFDAYVMKPFDGPELVSLLEGLLAPTAETLSRRPIELAPKVLSPRAED